MSFDIHEFNRIIRTIEKFQEELHKVYASVDLCHRRLQALDERLRDVERWIDSKKK